MADHVTNFETILESLDHMSPAELAVLQERIAHSRQEKASIERKPSKRNVFAIPYDKYLALSDAEHEVIQWRVYEEHHEWYEAELKTRRAQWILVCGGEVLEFSRTLDDYPTPEKLHAIGQARGFIPFVFVPRPLIEESKWSALDEDDFYLRARLAKESTVFGQSQSRSACRPQSVAQNSVAGGIEWRAKNDTGAC